MTTLQRCLCSLLLLLQLGVSGVDALVPRTTATLPDLRTQHALLGVIALCISVPIYVVSIVLLWRRRSFFPIAGRGFVYLITLAVVVLVAQIEMIAVLVAYPQGIPWSEPTTATKAIDMAAPAA